jgi:1-acyl-sn-glycerol-3-phosphate acyltransferase
MIQYCLSIRGGMPSLEVWIEIHPFRDNLECKLTMIRDLVALLARLVTGVRVISEEMNGGPPRIYYANHSSHLDFVVIWAALPGYFRHRVRPVAAADYWERGPIRRWLANQVFRAVLIPRGKLTREDDPIGKMIEAMDQGFDLIVFPEGTRSADGKVADFKAGIHSLAKQYPQAVLIPVYLENLNYILPKGEFLIVPVMGNAVFGPVCKGPHEGETRQDFLIRVRKSLLELASNHHPLEP